MPDITVEFSPVSSPAFPAPVDPLEEDVEVLYACTMSAIELGDERTLTAVFDAVSQLGGQLARREVAR